MDVAGATEETSQMSSDNQKRSSSDWIGRLLMAGICVFLLRVGLFLVSY